MHTRRDAFLAGSAVVVLWASAFPAIQAAVPRLGTIGLSGVRLVVATVADGAAAEERAVCGGPRLGLVDDAVHSVRTWPPSPPVDGAIRTRARCRAATGPDHGQPLCRRLRQRSRTPQRVTSSIDSRTMWPDIFDAPSSRSTNRIGDSTTRNPDRTSRRTISVRKA